MPINRVVIWGHRPKTSLGIGRYKIQSHTHSYIHSGYFRAFKLLGFETIWIDKPSQLPAGFESNHIFFTEGQVDDKLPISKKNLYVTHHSSPGKYSELGGNWIKLHNFVTDLLEGDSYSYPGGKVEKLDSVTFWDDANRALYQPWATDLFPSDVKEFRPLLGSDSSQINYVGTINHDGIEPKFKVFKQRAQSSGYRVRVHSGVSDEKARALVRDSAICLDIRGAWHLQRGYIPCRLWKILSYGRVATSNSAKLLSIFGNRVTFETESDALFDAAIKNQAESTLSQLVDNQNWVMQNHTFLNRARMVLEVLGIDGK
jgi:hypothetical protein